MGILTRRQGDKYVISSDLTSNAVTSKRAARRLSDVYQVWTGADWSMNVDDALVFDSMDEADDYVRAHYVEVTG